MAKSVQDHPRKTRGRPATGKDPMVGIRMSAELQAEVRAWAGRQPEPPGLAPAVRQLVEIGLSTQKLRGSSSRTRGRAEQLASEAIDRASDPMAEPDEVASRKRRILKGPSMARSVRKD